MRSIETIQAVYIWRLYVIRLTNFPLHHIMKTIHKSKLERWTRYIAVTFLLSLLLYNYLRLFNTSQHLAELQIFVLVANRTGVCVVMVIVVTVWIQLLFAVSNHQGIREVDLCLTLRSDDFTKEDCGAESCVEYSHECLDADDGGERVCMLCIAKSCTAYTAHSPRRNR